MNLPVVLGLSHRELCKEHGSGTLALRLMQAYVDVLVLHVVFPVASHPIIREADITLTCDEGRLQRDTQGFGDDVVPARRPETEGMREVCSDHGQHTCRTVPLSWLRALLGDDSLGNLLLDDGIELSGPELGQVGPLLVEESHVFQAGTLVGHHGLPRYCLSPGWGEIAGKSCEKHEEVRELSGFRVSRKFVSGGMVTGGQEGPTVS